MVPIVKAGQILLIELPGNIHLESFSLNFIVQKHVPCIPLANRMEI